MSLKRDLYVITDIVIQNRYSHIELAKLICKGGADMLQFREKNMSVFEMIETAKQIKKICKKFNVRLIVNDRIDVALLSDADGVHLGKEDIPVNEARRILGKNKLIGGTAHNLKEAIKAEKQGADYIGYGHIFHTSTKYKPDKPKGINKLNDICKSVSIPVYAIGGININNIGEIIKTGVKGAAVAGAIVCSEDPLKEVIKFKKLLS